MMKKVFKLVLAISLVGVLCGCEFTSSETDSNNTKVVGDKLATNQKTPNGY